MVHVVEHDKREAQEWMEAKLASPVAAWPRPLSSSGHFVMMSKCNRENQGEQVVAQS